MVIVSEGYFFVLILLGLMKLRIWKMMMDVNAISDWHVVVGK